MPATTTIKLLGMAGAASYALARLSLWSGLFAWKRTHVGRISREAIAPMPAGFVVRTLAAQELSKHSIDVGTAEQERRFAAGLTCLGCFNARGVLVGVVWMARSSAVETEIPIRFILPPDAAWDTGMWISERYRLGRAFAALWAGMGEWLTAEGLAATYSSIYDYNVRSLTAHRRLGFEQVGTALWIRLGRYGWLRDGDGRWQSVAPPERGKALAEWSLPPVPGGRKRSVQAAPFAAA